ncbi:SMI1/KNR4 family protein [Leptothoe kymatousa]|uniref:SMI1/KNR4 family protein n=1 Tax=Leptothoe kymatousa TAU-MAC 1615 TaxID=2364775 RepID=A0ABS5Y581_9CYAN|nr:SMI1/KNR4 family protein [Leptothoe kymatousa]MBT9312971.1 SMI1/KNR4 family protein [Leptothoe kymatousa TAU-MAC 1615]
MSSFNWLGFLTRWSQDILRSKHIQPQDSQQPQAWLGYPGATEEQLQAAEARLGQKLPPSYRAFLKVSNGWQETTPFIQDLGSSVDITWFATQYPDWLNRWIQRYRSNSFWGTHGATTIGYVSDQDYFTYGAPQDCRHLRMEYLQKTLAISAVNDAAIYLLNPEVVTEDGEWEAWFLADWLPGADRYPSFQALMEAECRNSQELRQEFTPPDTSIELSVVSNTDVQPRWQVSCHLWPGIEIERLCQWIIERVEQVVYSC